MAAELLSNIADIIQCNSSQDDTDIDWKRVLVGMCCRSFAPKERLKISFAISKYIDKLGVDDLENVVNFLVNSCEDRNIDNFSNLEIFVVNLTSILSRTSQKSQSIKIVDNADNTTQELVVNSDLRNSIIDLLLKKCWTPEFSLFILHILKSMILKKETVKHIYIKIIDDIIPDRINIKDLEYFVVSLDKTLMKDYVGYLVLKVCSYLDAYCQQNHGNKLEELLTNENEAFIAEINPFLEAFSSKFILNTSVGNSIELFFKTYSKLCPQSVYNRLMYVSMMIVSNSQNCSQTTLLKPLSELLIYHYNEKLKDLCAVKEFIKLMFKLNYKSLMKSMKLFGLELLSTKIPTNSNICETEDNQMLFSVAVKILKEYFKTIVDPLDQEEFMIVILRKVMAANMHTISYWNKLIFKLLKINKDLIYKPHIANLSIEVVGSVNNVNIIRPYLQTILPYINFNEELKNNFVLFLKKKMLNKKPDVVIIAIEGFLLILRHFKLITGYEPTTQYTQSTYTQTINWITENNSDNESVANSNDLFYLDIFGHLRRCLSVADPSLCRLVYQGLYMVACRNVAFQFHCLEIFYHQSKCYLSTETPSIDQATQINSTDTGVDVMVAWNGDKKLFIDDLACLFKYYLMTYYKINKRLKSHTDDNDDYDKYMLPTIQMLDTFSNKLSQVDNIEPFVQKLENYSPEAKSQLLRLLINLDESFIEYVYRQKPNMSATLRFQEILCIYYNICSYKNQMKALPIHLKQQKSSNFDLNFLADILHDLFCDTTLNKQELYKIFRENDSFIGYLMGCCKMLLTPDAMCKNNDEYSTSLKTKIMCKISRLCCDYINGTSILNDENNNQKFFSNCIELVDTYLQILSQKNNENLLFDFLLASSIASDDVIQKCNDADSFRYYFVLEFVKFFESNYENQEQKTSEKLLYIIRTLSAGITINSTYYSQIIQYFCGFITDNYALDIPISKTIFSIVLNMISNLPESTEEINTFIDHSLRDIHFKLGDIDEDQEELTESNHFKMINDSNSNTIYVVFINFMRQSFHTHVFKTLHDIKSLNLLVKYDFSYEFDLNDAKMRLEKINNFLIRATKNIHFTLRTAYSLDSTITSESLLQMTIVYFQSLLEYFNVVFGLDCGVAKEDLLKLIKSTSNEVIAQAYSTIVYIESSNQANLPATKSKKGKSSANNKAALAAKMNKYIPDLIYAIENYEKQLIVFSEKFHISLTKNLKSSTARDFKINLKKLSTIDS